MSLEKDIDSLLANVQRALGSELLELEDSVQFFNTEVISATPEGARAKVVAEAMELRDSEPEDRLKEMGDVLITLIGAAHAEGLELLNVIWAARRKMAINIHERTWEPQPDGSWQHVKKAA